MRVFSSRSCRMLMILIAGIAVLQTVVACSRGETELKNTVSGYTKMLVEALSKPDSKVMVFFASPDETKRIDSYILRMLQDKKVMVGSLKKIDFRDIELDKGKNSAVVTTYEEWSYQYVDEKSRQPVSQEELIRYNNVYHLVREQQHWVVDKIDSNEAKSGKQ